MKLKFTFSKKREIDKLINIYSEYQWFVDNDFPISLPSFYDLLYKETKTKVVFKKELIILFKEIYKRDIYLKKEKIIKENWKRVGNRVVDILNDLKLTKKDRYFCYLSLYGPQGQYEYPDMVDLRIVNEKDVREANETIIHELLHLLILNKVRRLSLDYETTEGLVDLFFVETRLSDIFPNYKVQSISRTDKVLFNKFINN
ncbi:MAG: hypothetical protein PHR47_01290 [Candidatus Pacebacteria bacterium]|nr:hypothetical protein [Candidatus Paceibacterota bacterium]